VPPIVELPYCPDSAELFTPLADRPWAMFLDSGRPYDTQGRYDILVADPVATLVTRGAITEIRIGETVEYSPDDPLQLLQHVLAQHDTCVADPSLPFTGGALGYFGYDLGRRFERLACTAADVESLPDMAVGIYTWAVVVDHVRQRSCVAGRGVDIAAMAKQFSRREPDRTRPDLCTRTALETNLDREGYTNAFKRIVEYIAAGDCYQVNLARRFSAPAQGDPWAGYRALRAANPAPFSAYLHTPDAQILSASPERFLQVRDGVVETRPIKGTRRRDPDVHIDRGLGQELLASAKDRAENVMIVDLLRNDLGKVCDFGSIRTEVLCALESFATVHHLVSTVTGRLAAGNHALDVLRACFPGGSITGAPKIRAMQIIEELEGERRGVYCGAIGYIGFDGAMDTNVAIRTLVHARGNVRFWAGGGIVVDSTLEAEYQETLTKAAPMFRLLKQNDVIAAA